ncbi:hypothetical protein [Psychrobacillus sp. OK032]|uniref:hypothetical protein n=1 Tax=Psychrobacillus sp. OK032 TaxID=1884358 RepID=UPI0008CBFF75|nr:hypothetical protein [Psychrobacillus sp. OK032]SES17795.1 hypothetical protein SAMN05518872_105124 [Psychrobacillus sp. OK032]
MQDLLNIINYLRCGKETFPTLAYFDDKEMSKEVQDKLPNALNEVLNINSMEQLLPLLLKQCEKETRALCFYPNGAKNTQDIEELQFHFIDIDGGNKEEQLTRINSAPLRPTLVYRGRAGHKILYAIENDKWDASNKATLNESIINFENIQMQLIEYFDGDRSKKNPNAAFRLPLTNNYKDFTKNGRVYKEEVVLFEPSHVYTQEQLSEAFPAVFKRVQYNESLSYESYPKEIQEAVECFIQYLDSESLSYIEYEGKLSYQCPIHNDSTASAYMFYNNLICHCSNGDAELDCDINKGKPLSWVAKEKGWTDLEELCKKLESKPAEEYENISLNDMQSNKLVPLQQTNTIARGNVKGVLSEVVDTMTKLRITVDETTTNIYANIINELDLQEVEGITVCPLEPGGGKSTIMGAYLKYMLEQSIPESGTIIVVERIETAKKLMKELGTYTIFIDADGKAIDAPYYESSPAAFVMESAYTYKDCKQKLEKYQYGVCRECPFKGDCIVYNKHQEQKKYPVVIMTHARLKMEADGSSKYNTWQCKDGNVYERKRIIIDEKPPLVDVITIQRTDFEQFLFDVRTMALDIGKLAVDETKVLIDQLREQLLEASSGKKILPINPDFVFPYSKTWYRKYSGDNVNLLRDIEYLIQQGGLVNQDQQRNISIVTNKIIQYDFSKYHVVILDGTAKFDIEYRALQNHRMLDIPSIKTYEHLTFFIDSSRSSSKGKLMKDHKVIADMARNISIFSINENVLVLCFKDLVNTFKSLLEREIKEGRVLINHYGNVKGSNEYSRCTTVVLIGTIHKGDPFYINKYEALYMEEFDTKAVTIKKVRRFKNKDTEITKLNDQIVETIQDILRISIRNNGATVRAKVYMLTRDTVFTNILQNYFIGCDLEEWNMSGTFPEWYEKLDEYFGALKQGETTQKATLREVLNLNGEAGKKQLQRYIKGELFIKLLGEHSIATENNRTYKKVDSFEVESNQAVI